MGVASESLCPWRTSPVRSCLQRPTPISRHPPPWRIRPSGWTSPRRFPAFHLPNELLTLPPLSASQAMDAPSPWPAERTPMVPPLTPSKERGSHGLRFARRGWEETSRPQPRSKERDPCGLRPHHQVVARIDLRCADNPPLTALVAPAPLERPATVRTAPPAQASPRPPMPLAWCAVGRSGR